MNGQIMVSICCITYNHEKYIKQALEGFVSQKTNFKYEVLIHDDASKDNTAKIIREYEEKYPDIIFPICQTENQYSKGIKPSDFNYNRVRGKYIAICEGDDYWIDDNKLQKQFDFMEANPEYSCCVHSALSVDETTGEQKMVRPFTENKTCSMEDLINGGGGFFPTASMFFKSVYKMDMPDYYKKSPVGDYPRTLTLGLRGKIYYMDENMSVYRANHAGSWSKDIHGVLDKRKNHFQQIIEMLKNFDEYSEYRYTDAVQSRVTYLEFMLLLMNKDYKSMMNMKYRNEYKKLSLRSRLYVRFKSLFK